MRRMMIGGLLLAAVASVVIGVAASASGRAARPAPTQAEAQVAKRSAVTADLVAARLATAKYATDLGRPRPTATASSPR